MAIVKISPLLLRPVEHKGKTSNSKSFLEDAKLYRDINASGYTPVCLCGNLGNFLPPILIFSFHSDLIYAISTKS